MREYLDRITHFCLNLLWVIICLPDYLHYKFSCASIAKAQSRILLRILKDNKETRFGREYGLSSISKATEFQDRVPVTTYDDYLGYIARVKKGEECVLTSDTVIRLLPTSGSASASKYIPYTAALKKEFLRGIRPWVFALYAKNRNLFLGKHYWSITPSGTDAIENKKGDVAIDFGNDGDYFTAWERIILRFLIVVPPEVSQIRDIKSLRYVSLLYLIAEKDLRFISIWNPMFLNLMLNDLPACFPMLLDDLENRRIHSSAEMSDQLRSRLEEKIVIRSRRLKELKGIYESWNKDRKIPIFKSIWPHLEIISCWASGNAAHSIRQLSTMFPGVTIEPKGLMATEGIISLPIFGCNNDSRYLAITSHFFEFLELDSRDSFCIQGRPRLAHQLEMGKRYAVLLTTGGGFYRYNLQDIIEVTGLDNRIPLIRFIGKADCVSDWVGEKLNSLHVEGVLLRFFAKNRIVPAFYMMAPEENPDKSYSYTLFVKVDDNDKKKIAYCSAEIDKLLTKNFHYRYCRKLNQLGSVRVFLINADVFPEQVYLYRATSKKGAKIGTTKIPVLDKEIGWSKFFQGVFIEQRIMADKAAV